MYGDNSVAVHNREKGVMVNYMCGHFQRVSAVRWLSSKLQSCFVTCSYDMSLYFWQHCGDRWSFTYFDMPMLVDGTLRHYRMAQSSLLPVSAPVQHRSHSPAKEEETLRRNESAGLRLTAAAAHPRHPSYIACGSSRGAVWILDTEKGRVLASFSPCANRVVDLSFSPSGNFLAIAYCTGLVKLYDARASFEEVLQLEEPLRANGFSDRLSKLYYVGVILTRDPTAKQSMQTATDSPLNLSRTVSKSAIVHDSKLIQREEPAFYAVCTHNLSTVRMHKIYVRDGRFIKDTLVDLPVTEGKIAGFDVHPSREYVTVLSDSGTIYVYQTHLAQLRGRLQVSRHAWGCRIDPSGLYVAVAVPSLLADDEATDPSFVKQSKYVIIQRDRHDKLHGFDGRTGVA